MRCSIAQLYGSCGYGIVSKHGQGYDRDWDFITGHWSGGTRLRVAAFVNEARCKQMYDWIKENGEIVYQSEPENNRNSGRLNFLVVFKV